MATNFNTNFNLNALSFCSYLFLFFLYYKYLISTKIQRIVGIIKRVIHMIPMIVHIIVTDTFA